MRNSTEIRDLLTSEVLPLTRNLLSKASILNINCYNALKTQIRDRVNKMDKSTMAVDFDTLIK